MIVHSMHFDGDEVIDLENPTSDDVLRWVKELDGKKQTVVAVKLDNGSSAEVEGGGSGQYKVNAHINGVFFDLASDSSTSYKRIPLLVGDDLYFYPEKYIVTLGHALTAMRHFCATGELSPAFSWSCAEDYYPFEPETRAKDEPASGPDRAGDRTENGTS